MSFEDSRLWDVLLILKDHGADVDLTKKWVSIEYEDTYPQSAIITLSASRGRFCTTGTIIEKWDRLFLKITDQNGDSVSTVVHVESLQKQRNEGGGLFLRLYCPHQSSNLLKQTISRPNRRTSGNKAMQEIVAQINENRATADPTVQITTPFDEPNKLGNLLDDTTTNNYIFESVKVIDAANEIVRREGNPVETGGSFQFMYFRLVSKYDGTTEADLDFVELQVFPQGFVFNTNDTEFSNIPNVTLNKPTLQSETRANVLSLDSDLQTEKGTNLIAIGDKNSGSYPIDYARFQGANEVYNSATEWIEGQDYSVSSLVTFPITGVTFTFTCIQANTANDGVNDPSTGLGTFWVNALFEIPDVWQTGINYLNTSTVTHNEVGYTAIQTAVSNSTNEPPNPEFWLRTAYIPTTNYSPLTNNKAQYWINASGGAKHAATENYKTSIVDANIIIKDQFHPRTWVDTVQEDPADIPSTLLEGGSSPFHTLRALAINPSNGANPNTGPWAPGNFDKNDVPFAGSILEFQDDPIEIDAVPQWVVINSAHPDLPQATNDQEVYDFDEGDSWIKNPCISGSVNDKGVCSIARSGVWQKGAYGIIGGSTNFQSDKQFDCIHPLEWDSSNSRVSIGNEQIIDELNSDTSGVFAIFNPFQNRAAEPLFNRSFFGGMNFAFPWPRTSNAAPYGAVTIGEQIALTQFDILNMHLTKNGKKEWFGARVEDYYPIQAFEFQERLEQTYNVVVGSFYAPFGYYKQGLWIADRFDNQWMMDYTHGNNDVTSPQSAILSNRKIYRGVPGISTFIPAQEPEVLDIPDPRSIVRGGIQTKDSFDNQGRYNILNRFNGSDNIKVAYDSFRMTKPLVTTNNDDANGLPERNIEPLKLQAEKVTTYSQLKNYVLTMEQILGFRPDAFTIRAPGRCNVQYGDPVYYTDPEAINETTDSIANTVKATASKITYSLSKTAEGPVGFYRVIELITRLYPDDAP